MGSGAGPASPISHHAVLLRFGDIRS